MFKYTERLYELLPYAMGFLFGMSWWQLEDVKFNWLVGIVVSFALYTGIYILGVGLGMRLRIVIDALVRAIKKAFIKDWDPAP